MLATAQPAALAPRKKVPSLIAGVSSHPADLYLPCWKNGKPAALDVTVISPLQKLTIQEAYTTQVHTLSVEDKRKRALHQNPCQAIRINFVPLAVETFGEWRQEAVETIKLFGYLHGQRLGFVHLRNNCTPFPAPCHSLWKGNACMCANKDWSDVSSHHLLIYVNMQARMRVMK